MKLFRKIAPSLSVLALGAAATTSAFGQAQCQLSSSNHTVTICTPANGSTVMPTFHVNAGVTDTSPVDYMQVYVNDHLYLTQNHNYIDGSITVPPGTGERLVVQAHDGQNYFSKTQFVINVQQTPPPPPSGLNYLTWKNDNQRTGLQSNETVLTPANVNGTNFGRKYTTTVDGDIWPQPLFMAGVRINGVVHDTVFVATSKDSVYGIDANSGAVLWRKSLLPTGANPVNGHLIHSSVPEIGVVGTPVIDPSTGTLYAVTQTSENGGHTYVHRLHALSVSSGAEKFGGPVVVSASGFNSAQQLQRPGLLLANGNVYVAFGSNEDVEPYNGWIFSYNASTLGRAGVWNVTPGGEEGAIWQSAAGLGADANGDIYAATGNGDWNGTTKFGQSLVHLTPALVVTDYFTPYLWQSQNAGDKDLGSGSPLIVPDQNGNYPHELIGCSKLNYIYVVNRDSMGRMGGSRDNVIQEIVGQVGSNSGEQSADKCFMTPAYWNHHLYFIGNDDSLKMFNLNEATGLLSTTPVSKDTHVYSFPGGQPVVSANGNSNAVVWAIDWSTKTLRAYNANNVSQVLYVSPAFPSDGIKFTAPTVVSGHVFVGTKGKLLAFGELNNGSCSPPNAPGVNFCAPSAGQTYSSPVHFSAAGTGANPPVNHMELWIDGDKINDYPGNTMDANVSLGTGSHGATAVEVDSHGAYIKSSVVTFTVQ